MTVDWWYSLQFFLNQIQSPSIFDQTILLITLLSLVISGIFLVGIIHALYTNYKENKSVETLFFLVGMICLIIAAVLAILVNITYNTWGLKGLGDLLAIINNVIGLVCILLVNLFSIRVTSPKRYKIILAILLVLSAILVYTGVWAVLQGPPYSRVIDFVLIFSLEFILIRFFGLLTFAIIPISLFFYYAKNIRKEQIGHSNRSIWLGLGILFFFITILVGSVIPRFLIIQVLYLPASIIFYVCFSMPDWFKRKIGWPE